MLAFMAQDASGQDGMAAGLSDAPRFRDRAERGFAIRAREARGRARLWRGKTGLALAWRGPQTPACAGLNRAGDAKSGTQGRKLRMGGEPHWATQSA